MTAHTYNANTVRARDNLVFFQDNHGTVIAAVHGFLAAARTCRIISTIGFKYRNCARVQGTGQSSARTNFEGRS